MTIVKAGISDTAFDYLAKHMRFPTISVPCYNEEKKKADILTKNRLEAMTDGVVAIILTLLVLDLKTPDKTTLAALAGEKMVFFAYIASFIYVAIIWNAHHQMFQHVEKINKQVVFANFCWIFWLSLAPFATSWMAKDFTAFGPALLYAFVFAMWTFSFNFLGYSVAKCNPKVAQIRQIDLRNHLSILINLILLVLVFFWPPVALFGRLVVAALWALPAKVIKKWFWRE